MKEHFIFIKFKKMIKTIIKSIFIFIFLGKGTTSTAHGNNKATRIS